MHRVLDRKLHNRFILTLLAKNRSSITKPAFHKFSEVFPPETRLSSTVTVIIKDINSPTFSQAIYRVEVVEDTEPWSEVEATNLDCEDTEDIEYSITSEVRE